MNLDRTQTARNWADRAAAALDAAQWGEANALVRQAIRENPDDAETRLLDAEIQLRRNLPEFALVALDAHDQLNPGHAMEPRVAILRAQALTAASFDDLAERLLLQLVTLLPQDARPHRMLAGIYVKLDSPHQAAEHLRQVIRLDPRNAVAGRMLSRVLESIDPHAATETAMTQTGGTVPDPGDALRQARMCRRTDRLRDAAELYARLLEQRGDDAALWLEAGELADELGENDLAVKRLITASTLDRRHRAAALNALAVVHLHAGRFGAAARTWWQLAREQSDQARPWAGLWLSAWCAGRPSLAAAARRRLVGRSDAAARCAILADLWPHVAHHRAAEALVPQASGPTVLSQLTGEAARTLARAATNFPGRADVHFHRAVCEHTLAQPEHAAESLRQALHINPHYAAARHLLDLIESAPAEPA